MWAWTPFWQPIATCGAVVPSAYPPPSAVRIIPLLEMWNLATLSKAVPRQLCPSPAKFRIFPRFPTSSRQRSLLSPLLLPRSASYTTLNTNSSHFTSACRKNNPRQSPRAFVGYCSHRRMCHYRRHDAGASGSVVDITAGREILPANVKPTHYRLTLEPNFEKFTFNGTVVIE